MAEIRLNVPEDVEKRFRKTARTKYGEDKNAEDKAATEALAKWSRETEESLIPATTRVQFTRGKEEDNIDPNEPIFTHLTDAAKTGKKGRVSVDHDNSARRLMDYLRSNPPSEDFVNRLREVVEEREKIQLRSCPS